MKTEKAYRTNNRRHTMKRKVLAAVLTALVLASGITGFGKGLANAQDADAQDPENVSAQEYQSQTYTAEKYYKSIQIQPGDSLWSIAEENRDAHYASVNDYVKEIKQINSLSSDQIHSGQYLTIAYYK